MTTKTYNSILAVAQLAALIAITTALEFSGVSWGGWLALVLTIALGSYWAWRGNQRFLLYAVIVLSLFPEVQSGTIGGFELHHVLAAVLALTVFMPWIVLRPCPLPRLSRLLIVYYVLGGVLTALNLSHVQSTQRLLVTGLFILIAILIPFVIKTKKELLELFWVLIGATLVSVGVGLAAYYYASITHSLFTNPYIHISTVEGVPRLAATLLDSNFLGHQLLLVLPALLLLTWYLRAAVSKELRRLLFGVTILLSAILWLTYSRSTYIGLAAALVILLVVLRRRIVRLLATIAIASIALATVLVPSFPFYSIYRFPSTILPEPTKQELLLGFNPRALVDEYIKQIQSDPNLSEEEREQLLARDVSSESLGYRIEFWKAGLRMFKDHPLTGVGVGQFRYQFAKYSDLSFIQQPDTHNIFVEQLAETGIFGESALLLVLSYATWTLITALRRRKSLAKGPRAPAEHSRLEALALLAALVALVAQSTLLGGLGALPIYLTLGLVARYSSNKPWLASLKNRRGKLADKKRIVFITATTKKDGPGNVLFAQINGLDRKKYEPVLITILRRGPWDAEYKKMGIKRINLGLVKPLDILAPFVLWVRLAILKPDLIQTQMIRGDVYGRWAAMRTGSAFISVVHNMDIWKQTHRRFHRFATWFDAQGLREARQIVAVSQAVKQDVHVRQGIALSKITVIHNAVDFARFSRKATQAERTKTMHDLKLDPNKATVLTVARVHPQKAPEIWLMAALRVLKKNPKTQFVWVDTGPLFEQMRAAVPPEYRDRVKFVGRRKDIPMLLHLADVFVLPSRFEGLPMVLLEAMSSGRASVATNVSGNPELITHNKTGLLVEPEKPQQLANAILKLLRDNELAKQLGSAAQEFVRTEFTTDRLSREYQDLFAALLD